MFTISNIEDYKSIKRLKEAISESSWRVLRFGVIEYCNFLKLDPDTIIADRNATFKADDLDTRRKHEDTYRKFIDHLKTLKSKHGGGPLAPKSMDNMTIGVKGLYTHNFVALVEPKKMEGIHPIKVTHIPTQEELGLILEALDHPVYKAVSLAEAQSGTSIGDLLDLTWDMRSDTFGTIRKQVDEGITVDGIKHPIVHIHSVRQKTNVGFDSFFGSRTVEALRVKGYPLDSRVFPTQIGHLDTAISEAAKKVGIEGDVTSHLLRKFFATQLKLANVNSDLVEYWQGHALAGARGAYFIPPPKEQVKIYLTYEGNISPLFKGETIIQQVRPAAQAPVIVHELPAPIIQPLTLAVAPPTQSAPPVIIPPVVQPKSAPTSVPPTPVFSTPPPKTVLKIADIIKLLEKKK